MELTKQGNPITDEIIKHAVEMTDAIVKGTASHRIVTYANQKVREVIQINKDNETYSRYHLPVNGDKSKAIQHNAYLEREEVIYHFIHSLADLRAEQKAKGTFSFSKEDE